MRRREQILSRILKIIPEVKQGLVKATTVNIVYEAIKIIPVILIKLLVDTFISESSSISLVSWIVGGMFAVYLIENLMDYFGDLWSHKQMLTYETVILRKSQKKLLELHMGYHEKYNPGLHVSRINKGASKLTELVWFFFNEFLPTIIQLVLTTLLLFYEQYIIAIIFLVFSILIFIIIDKTAKEVQPLREIYLKKHEQAFSEMSQSLQNIVTVKDYAQERKEYQIYSSLLRQFFKSSMYRMRFEMKRVLGRDVIINIGRILTLAVAGYLVLQGDLSAGSLILVYTLSEKAFLSVFRLGKIYTHVGDSIESIHRLSDLLDQKPQITNSETPIRTKKLEGGIEFKNVSFRYGKKSPWVLKNVSFTINPKKVIALVGRSGGGKSSIIKLIMRQYDVLNGEVLVDKIDVREYHSEDFRKRVAIVSQNVEVFNRSIKDNIAFSKPHSSLREIVRAAKLAHAHEFIKDLPDKYNTKVGKDGIKLSGGQKQRLSIARALLSNPDILI
ncbi:ABC transporter ATP-binding protein, partial [Candidatus Woesearchaeota archaeon]|nr:ABC transporter ATP-binding protein [Candidatus Woesearchaeota archaeon]